MEPSHREANICSATNLGDAIDRSGYPGDTALIDLKAKDSPQVVSYARLDNLSDGIARGLLNRGVQRGQSIAVCAYNRIEYVAALLGIMRAGLIAVPINIRSSASSAAFMLRDTGAALVFCDKANSHLCPTEIPTVIFDDPSFHEFIDPGPFQPIIPRDDDTALILFTSGSTGRPKGVILSHQSHLWVLKERLRDAAVGTERYLVAAPLYHLNALAVCQTALAQHNTIVLLPSFSPKSFIEGIRSARCTSITAVPAMIAMLLKEKELLARTDLSSVKAVRMGSAPAPANLVAAIREIWPQADITTRYGSTEVGPIVFGPHPDGLPTPLHSAGARYPKVDLRLVDESGTNAAEGVLQVRSPALMSGYQNLPQETQRALTSDGYYITNDLFRRDVDGFYYFLGRADDMFVCGGENIHPAEVEKILESHPQVKQAVVVPIPDELKGHKPAAFVVPRDNCSLDVNELRNFCAERGGAYQHPRRLWFIEEMPLASTNKIDRALLKKIALETVAGSHPPQSP